MFCNPLSTTIALSRAQEKSQSTNVRLFSIKAIDYSIGWYAPNVKARYSAFTSSPKNHSDRDIAADIFLSSSPILCNIQHMPICHENKLWSWVEICPILEATFSGWTTLVKALVALFFETCFRNENKVRSLFRIRRLLSSLIKLKRVTHAKSLHTTLLHFGSWK